MTIVLVYILTLLGWIGGFRLELSRGIVNSDNAARNVSLSNDILHCNGSSQNAILSEHIL